MEYEQLRQEHNNGLTKLDYNYIPEGQALPDQTIFRIQASQISNFFDYTNSWYREKLLGGSPMFGGNTSSILGTCIHWAAECYIKDKQITEPNKEEMYAYIDQQATNNTEIDAVTIRQQLTPMWRTLREYIDRDPGGLVEPFIELEILPGITAGGSIDRLKPVNDNTIYHSLEELRGKTVDIQDWKTTSALSAPTKITKNYEWQLLVYAYVLHKKYDITTRYVTDVFLTRDNCGRLNASGKPMKDYPSVVGEVSKPVTEESLLFIESLIKVVAHSVEAFVTKPELRYLLMQDYRYKSDTTTLPFTSISNTLINI